MASDAPAPRSTEPARRSRGRGRIFGTWAGRLLLVLVAIRLLGAVGGVPDSLTTISTVGLWLFAGAFLLWGLGSLRRKLLWKIRRKLIISYLLIGLVPTLLILFFFTLSAYFIVGQVSSYMLNSELQRSDARAAGAADLALAEIEVLKRSDSTLTDSEFVEVLRRRLGPLNEVFPGSVAIYIERSDNRAQRIVTTASNANEPAVGALLPAWLSEGYQGPFRMGRTAYSGAVSGGGSASEGDTVLVLSPLHLSLERAANVLGFHIDQVLTSVADESSNQNVFIPHAIQGGGTTPDRSASGFTVPWWALLSTRSLDTAQSEEPDLIFVQFGFPLSGFYDTIAANALQLGPDGPDLGRIILAALAFLAVLFLIIEVLAIFVGLVLARSITRSVHALSQGTEHIRQGDFDYKVQVRSRDQLGELADSFNSMTASIQDLLHQSAEKERLEEELRVARSIQQSLLPKDRIHVPGLSIAALCLPATEVGGDYYDFIPLPDGRLALLIADVSGKGTSAALYMAELKGLVLSLSQIYDSPRKLLVEANKILAANLDSRSFITMCYAVLDVEGSQMTFARAGHNPIFQLPKNGTRAATTRVLAPDGLGLALDRGTRFEAILQEQRIPLSGGDLFLFFTDGISEAMNSRSELFGERRLREVLERNRELSMEELREKLVDEVFGFAGGAVQHDDMTMVLVKVL
jgi:sigma-B regulation protein RsbU (phosphoserine phosphatase)